MRRFSREEILKNLRKKIQNKQALLFGSAGLGLTAKMQEQAGIDVIMTYCACAFRADGIANEVSQLAYVDANEQTMELGRRLLKIVKKTPVIGGIGAADPYRDLEKLIMQLWEQGFSGFINAPSIGQYDALFRKESDGSNIGYPQEVEMIRLCREKNIFSTAFVFQEEDACRMAGAGADVVCVHLGVEESMTVEEAGRKVRDIRTAAKEEREDVIVICHGGCLKTPENVQQCLLLSGAEGFFGSSVLESIPMQQGIGSIVKEFKSLQPR